MSEPLATGDVLRRFLDRIDRDLGDDPLGIDPEAHRRRLAELLAVCGSGTHYELLALDPSADEVEVHEAFRRVARTVHPRHAGDVGLGARAGVLQVLFERATEAYLVLSDPHRRDEYDRLIATELERPSDPDARVEESRRVAAELHERARELMEREDYHFAVELLRQAVRMDPGAASAWALLGRAQGANPKWLHMAADSLRRALQLQPESIEHRFALAAVARERGDDDLAARLYREILERQPGHPEAVEALEAIEEARRAAAEAEGGRRGLFRRRR